ncbi:MAG TPA: DUF2278 family protein [Bryobacteraceae bacterium]|jgi:uncharacterized protein YukJ|nr:DUF2278 family protein [Bryobacteraceae bacterium]
MPIPNYSVLKGDPVGPGTISGSNPHYRFSLRVDDGSSVEVDVNVQSTDGSEIRYLIVQNFQPIDPAGLLALRMNRTALANTTSDLRLDYVLEHNPDGTPMVDRSKLQLLDIGDGTLNDAVANLLNQALADPNGVIYAFGSYYDDNGVGIHDIHLNQGNPPGPFAKDNGSWQDGGIIIQLPGQAAQWTALFIAFQTQTF